MLETIPEGSLDQKPSGAFLRTSNEENNFTVKITLVVGHYDEASSLSDVDDLWRCRFQHQASCRA
jgi:hypothetical protein